MIPIRNELLFIKSSELGIKRIRLRMLDVAERAPTGIIQEKITTQ